MDTWKKVAIGGAVAVVVVGGIYMLSRSPSQYPADANGLPLIPDNQQGNPASMAGSDNQVIATGITNVLTTGIREGFATLRDYNTTVAAQNRDRLASSTTGAATAAAQAAARARKMQA